MCAMVCTYKDPWPHSKNMQEMPSSMEVIPKLIVIGLTIQFLSPFKNLNVMVFQ